MSGALQAQIYQYKDTAGNTVLSDRPPLNSKGYRTIQEGSVPEAASHTEKALAEQEAAFQTRQQQRQMEQDKVKQKQMAQVQRQEECERARQHVKSLESGERLMTRNQSGERVFVEDTQRQREIERGRKMLAEICN